MPPIPILCPHCRQLGTFAEGVQPDLLLHDGNGECGYYAGHRLCPNPKCQGHVFVVHRGHEPVVTYPPMLLDFDPRDIPATIQATFKEALLSHATGCFVAAGMLIRKTLEQLCEDRAVGGPDLKARIQALRSKIVLPNELFDGLDDLRLLGNDAAHVHAKTYAQIGPAELAVSIEFAKEVLKAVYQYAGLSQRLKALKKP